MRNIESTGPAEATPEMALRATLGAAVVVKAANR